MELNTNLTQIAIQSSQGEALVMSSREIAELCEKKHQHVKRDIEVMCAGLEINVSTFGHIYKDARNRDQTEYLLPKDLSITLVAGYNVKLRKKIIDRWMELEAAQNARPVLDFSDPKVMLGVFTHLQEQVAERDFLLIEQGERLTKLDRIEGAAGNICITDAAKTLKVKPLFLFNFMHSRRWIYKRTGNKNWIAYQDKMPDYLDHKEHLYIGSDGGERVSTHVVVTPKGLVKLAELLDAKLH